MPTASSLPYLPGHIVEQLKNDPIVDYKTSIVNFRDTERYRVRVISQKTHPHVPVTGIVPPPEEQVGIDPRVSMALRRWQRTNHKCQLHLAAMELDIPLVHEALRMSNNPSYKDADGVTPLFLALESARSHIRFGPNVRVETRTHTVTRFNNRAVRAKVTRIVTLLAEQHGDIESGFEERTPLSIAVELSLWEVVEVLLRHGVKIPPLKKLSFKNNDSKMHYLKLVTSIGEVAFRPPRRCPCWSGKLLSECHAADWIPYPEELLCFCGKNKLYGNCCLKRGFKWVERWNEREDMFLPTQDTNPMYNVEVPEWLTRLPAYHVGLQQMQQDIIDARSKGGDAMRNLWRMPEGEDKTQGYYFNIMLKNNPDFEPAFAHANTKSNFIPRPWRDEFSKFEGKSRMEIWNGYVDEYIASGKDKRPRFEIERLSKIGSHGGPLYRRCEAVNCERYEGRDVAAFKQCSGCKISVYCSQGCQKAHWKLHKKECGKPNQREQQLPIQAAHERCIQMLPAIAGMMRGGMTKEEMVMRVGEVMLAEFRGETSQSEMVDSPLNQIFNTIAPGRKLETMSAPFALQRGDSVSAAGGSK